MPTHSPLKGKAKKILLSGEYFNVPTPVGVARVAFEVTAHVQVRVDPQGDDVTPGSESGRDDLQRRLNEVVERLGEIIAVAKKATPSEERLAQIELFEGLEGR